MIDGQYPTTQYETRRTVTLTPLETKDGTGAHEAILYDMIMKESYYGKAKHKSFIELHQIQRLLEIRIEQ